MWRYLPQAKTRRLAVVAALIAAFYAAIAAGFALHAMRQPVGLVLAPLFGLLALGMWTLSRFARWVTVIWLWLTVLVMPLGIFMPLAAGGQGAPYWGTLLAGLTPLIVLALFFLYILGKHKREFKWP